MAVSKEIIVNEDSLSCSICLELFVKPRTLPCLHSFCNECLIGYIGKAVQDKQNIHCPLCRADTHIDIKLFDSTEKWVENLPVNFMLVSILSSRKNKMAADISYCGPCLREETKVPAVIHCLECSESLCESCRKFHQKMKSLSSHKLYHIGEEKTDIDQLDFLKSLTKCPEHAAEDVRYICRDHDQLCCNECAIVKHRKCDNMVSLADEIVAMKNTGQETKERLDEIKDGAEKLIQYKNVQKSAVQASEVQVDEKIVKIKNIIDKAFLKMKQNIANELAEKSGNIRKQINMQIEGTETLKSEVDQSRKKLEFVCENGEKVHLFLMERIFQVELKRHEDMLQKFRRESSVETINVIEDITDQDLAKIITSCFHIGEKDMEPVLKYEKKLTVSESNARSCIFLDNYLLVAFQEMKQIQLLVVDKKALIDMTTKKTPSVPWSMAKIDNLKFAVCFPDAKTIELMKITDGSFVTLKIINTDKDIWDISFDKARSEMICHSRSGALDIYKLDGTNTKSISLSPEMLKAARSAYSICFDSERDILYISCHGLNKLLAFRLNGETVFEYSSSSLTFPWHIDLDRDGNIYVPFFFLAGANGAVHQINKCGKLIREIRLPGNGLGVCFDKTKTKFIVSSWSTRQLSLQMYHLI